VTDISETHRGNGIIESYSTPASRAVNGVGETTTVDEVLSPDQE